ncbi:MAG TPA: choice-of-anchor D domain-containing protein, partial [Candidatus Kapabacteria bacterium]|nr:choice-of-anchor D domain-containing protein [Candidatus Kapabacteria bacterium]
NLIQVPIFVLPNAALGPVEFYVFTPTTGLPTDTISFDIDAPEHLGILAGAVTIGNGFGQLSAANTIIVDSFIATNANIHFSIQDPDTFPGNPRLQPVVLLSKGPIRLTNSTISVDADSLDGGPGGGGGGHGFPGAGGSGFTGGGSCPSDSLGNSGSDSSATLMAGGRAATGVVGGESNPDDQGGGGGTGAPYGSSGAAGIGGESSSPLGGYGGGSGGGEAQSPQIIEYGGGGGGFGTDGTGGGQPGGTGANGGNVNDGQFLVPLAGGSGGGAGNSDQTDGAGGSGGGAGGAIEIVAFDSIVCNSAILSARGDSGTSGFHIAAGGGGGSGGAIYFATPRGVRSSASQMVVTGGVGGRGAISGFSGGAGGLGRVRIDGPSNLVPNAQLTGVWSNGISLSPNGLVPTHGFVKLSGIAQDTINTLDSIRIYYRTRHSAWHFVDTVRAPNGSWSKWLPLSHDSLLFAAAMVEVRNPAPGTGRNGEPSWLVSDASLSILHHPASPLLVSGDTLNFGAVRIGRCETLPLRIANDGEEPLIIAKGAFSGSPGFSVVPNRPDTILPYTSDTFEVEFCPDSAKAVIGTLSFASNDSSNSPKIVTLLGIGLAIRDSLAPFPDSIRFVRVLIDSCATDTITLKSVGHDTLYFSRSFWNDPPFTIRLVPMDTALDSGATRKLLITFCPADSGNFAATQVLDLRGDSIVMTGRGVLRRAASISAIDLGTFCLGHGGIAMDTISNLGNDTMSIFAYHGHRISRDSIGLLLKPNARVTIDISIPADSPGSFPDTVSFDLADSTLTTIITYRVTGASLSFLGFHFGSCVGDCDTGYVTIASDDPDALALSLFNVSSPFTLLDSASVLVSGQSDTLHLSFCPTDSLVYFDTLRFHAIVGNCDSEISIPLSGEGVIMGIIAYPVDFGSVFVGGCTVDSMFIQNSCGPTAIIDSISNSNADFKLVLPQPDTIPVNSNRNLAFRFCASMAGNELDTATLFLHTGETIHKLLTGVGIPRANPTAYFTISDTTVRMGDQAVSLIRLDSSSLTGLDTLRAVVSFDPIVLSPVSSYPGRIVSATRGSITFSEVLNFQDTGFLDAITWNTLAGPRDRSAIGLSVTTDTPLTVTANNGSVTLIDCFGLAG